MNFVNTDDDHDYEKPIWGLAGWSKDGRSALVYDKYDVWQLPLNGAAKPVDLTRVRARRRRSSSASCGWICPAGRSRRLPGPLRRRTATEDHGVDLAKPLTLSAYGEWTKKSGYWTLKPGRSPSR